MKLEQAVTWLAALYQPANTVNKTPHPPDNAFEVHEAHWLSQVGSMLVVEGETPLAPVSFKCPATHSDNDDTNHPTPSKHVKQDATKTQTAPSPGPYMRQQLKAFVMTFCPESVVLDESDDSRSVQATRKEARDQHEMKVAEKVFKVAEKEAEKVKKVVEKVKREAEKVVKNTAKEKNIAGKVSEKRNGKVKQNLTLKTPVSESLSLNTPVDPIIKTKKNNSDFGTCDVIFDAYNAQQQGGDWCD